MLVAATLANRYRFRQEHWLFGKITRVTRRGEKMSIAQWVTLVVAVIVIIVTAWIEDQRALERASEMAIVPLHGTPHSMFQSLGSTEFRSITRSALE